MTWCWSTSRAGICPRRSGRVSHRDPGQFVPARTPKELLVTFRTVHASKGLEADYIVIPNLSNGVYGFPSRIVDHPILDLAMADPDDFPHAEERRLFYVALTRARHEVVMFVANDAESPFFAELLTDELVSIRGAAGSAALRACPTCDEGLLALRQGRYGEFLGCNRFPRCRYTERTAPQRDEAGSEGLPRWGCWSAPRHRQRPLQASTDQRVLGSSARRGSAAQSGRLRHKVPPLQEQKRPQIRGGLG